jgi:chromosome partitioning protein
LLGRAEIHDSDVVKNAAAEFKTIYDVQALGQYSRAIDSFDAMVDEIEGHIQGAWAAQLLKEKEKANVE